MGKKLDISGTGITFKVITEYSTKAKKPKRVTIYIKKRSDEIATKKDIRRLSVSLHMQAHKHAHTGVRFGD